MVIISVLACLAFGVALVAVAQRHPARADHMEKVGGMLLVVGLVGLGFVLASRA